MKAVILAGGLETRISEETHLKLNDQEGYIIQAPRMRSTFSPICGI